MSRLFIVILLGLSAGCRNNYTQYYFGKENFRTFYCSWKHYIVLEEKGDSLQVWNLDDECNAGYWTTENITIPKKEGKYGSLNIEKINGRKIVLYYDRGYEKIKFTLNRTVKKAVAVKVINITQMLSIDSALERHIQLTAKNADKNTSYLTENYLADDKAGLLDPNEFRKYYTDKKGKLADSIINQLDAK